MSEAVDRATGEAFIDWAQGRVLGYAVPLDESIRHERVELCLDGVAVTSAVAQTSVFDFAEAWGGLALPPQESCAFVLRIPQASLLPSQLQAGTVKLGVRDGKGDWLLEQVLQVTKNLVIISRSEEHTSELQSH